MSIKVFNFKKCFNIKTKNKIGKIATIFTFTTIIIFISLPRNHDAKAPEKGDPSSGSSIERKLDSALQMLANLLKRLKSLEDKVDKIEKEREQNLKPPSSEGAGVCAIQVASFRTDSEAAEKTRELNASEELKKRGLQGRWIRADVPGKGVWHRVLVESFESKMEADHQKSKLIKAGVIGADSLVTDFGVPR